MVLGVYMFFLRHVFNENPVKCNVHRCSSFVNTSSSRRRIAFWLMFCVVLYPTLHKYLLTCTYFDFSHTIGHLLRLTMCSVWVTIVFLWRNVKYYLTEILMSVIIYQYLPRLMMMVISKFNGTSTPKELYSAKAGVNCLMSLNRVH